jgi:3'(2'), 5'-bisphosphate nucleotidase
MSPSMNHYSTLLKPVMALAIEAGDAIMELYGSDQVVEQKTDHTPVTAADRCADAIITAGLKKLTPHLPILSEEGAEPAFAERQQWQQYWLVDPLDGTTEFIERSGEFCVNIALIENNQPVLGVIYAPALKVAYEACRGFGAFKYNETNLYDFIQTRRVGASKVVALSRRHGQRAHGYGHRLGEHEFIYQGSALKICLVAEGAADVFPRFGKTSEWDTAAGQCILEEAGGRLMDLNGQELQYNTRASLINPEFLAVGDWQHDWLQYLTE